MIDKYQKAIDLITNEYTAGDYFREVYEAKKSYFENLGVIAEEDPGFENQMDVFIESRENGFELFDQIAVQHKNTSKKEGPRAGGPLGSVTYIFPTRLSPGLRVSDPGFHLAGQTSPGCEATNCAA